MTRATQAAVDHAYRRWSRPQTDQLGPPPVGCRMKLRKDFELCYERKRCPLRDEKKCRIHSEDLPWCFEPEIEDEAVRRVAAEAVQRWKEGIYIVVIV